MHVVQIKFFIEWQTILFATHCKSSHTQYPFAKETRVICNGMRPVILNNIDRITVELRLNTSTHVPRALKWTTFCQGMQLKKYGHFGTGTSHQNPRFHQNV